MKFLSKEAALRLGFQDTLVRAIALHLQHSEFAAADRLAERWLARRPEDVRVWEFYAFSAHSSGRYAQAKDRWKTLLGLAPQVIMAHAGLACNHRELGELEQAADVIATALATSPTDAVIRSESVLVPTDAVLRSEAVRVASLLAYDQRCDRIWRAVIAGDASDLDARIGFADALTRAERFREAGIELDQAIQISPHDHTLKVKRFYSALDAGEWLVACDLHHSLPKVLTHTTTMELRIGAVASSIFGLADDLRVEQPEASLRIFSFLLSYASDNFDWYLSYIRLSAEMGRLAEARRELCFAKALHQGNHGLSLAGCLISVREQRWAEALDELNIHLSTWPGDSEALAFKEVCERERGTVIRDPALKPSPRTTKDRVQDDDARDVLLRFQSLGQNCEFGIVQRAFGAESMGLFRFNTTTLPSLSEALSAGLEGLGAPEHTIMSLWEDHEYYLFDRRWGFGFHTFISKHDAVYDELYGKVCRHLSYLKKKLLEDLRDADKIFVIGVDEPTLDGLQELHSILATYGPVRLLCVTSLARCASLGHNEVEVGDIVEVRPTLHVGYISWLGRGAIGWRIQFEEWLSICSRYLTETLQTRSSALVFDGDSIAVSHGVPAGAGLADQVVAALAFGGKMTVVGAGGRSVEECTRLFAEKVAPLRCSGPNVIFFHAGDNDIDKGADAQTVYDRLTLYIDQAHRAGWKVVVSTELQRFDFPPVWQRELSNYNAAILANEAGADGVVDFNGDPIMGGPEHRTDCSFYQQDGVHPTSEGYAGLSKSTVAELQRHF